MPKQCLPANSTAYSTMSLGVYSSISCVHGIHACLKSTVPSDLCSHTLLLDVTADMLYLSSLFIGVSVSSQSLDWHNNHSALVVQRLSGLAFLLHTYGQPPNGPHAGLLLSSYTNKASHTKAHCSLTTTNTFRCSGSQICKARLQTPTASTAMRLDLMHSQCLS